MKLNNEICISFLQGSGWMRNHDKEITEGARNKALDDLFNTPFDLDGITLKEIYEDDVSNDFDYGWDECYERFELIAEQLKAGDANEK